MNYDNNFNVNYNVRSILNMQYKIGRIFTGCQCLYRSSAGIKNALKVIIISNDIESDILL